jgi:gas vesicle protein
MSDWDYEDAEPYVVIEKSSGGVGTFFLGIAIGAGLALLFAPASGEETRRGLSRGARRVKRAAEDAVNTATERVGETFENARQRVEEKLDQARASIDVKREQVHRAVRAGREAAQQAREDLERRLAETKAAYNAGREVARDAREARAASKAREGE